MTSRVKRLRDELCNLKDSVCLERARIVTEAYKKYESDSPVMKKAKALRDVLEKMPIYIREGDLIVGTPTSRPGAWIVYPEFGLGTNKIHYTENDPEKKGFIRKNLSEETKEYWSTRNLYAKFKALMQECYGQEPHEDNWFMITGLGHLTVDFSTVLEKGLEEVLRQAKKRLERARQDDPEGACFLRAVIISIEGALSFANRYAKLTKKMAEETSNPTRKKELQKMADILQHVPVKGARTFWESLQSVWLCNQVMHIEGNGYSMSPGRVDKLFYPFFKHDLEEGEISLEKALELAECFFIKFRENSIWGPYHNETQPLTLSGSTAEGEDQTNELSYLFLEGIRELKLPEPPVFVRWHKNIPDDFMHECFKCQAAGLGMPMFMSDEATPKAFMNLGIDKRTAYEYTAVGCNEIGITGKLHGNSIAAGRCGYVSVLLDALKNAKGNGQSVMEQFPTFKQLIEAIKEKMRKDSKRSVSFGKVVGYMHQEYGQVPFTSSFMHGCIERARDLTLRSEYNFPTMDGMGFTNMINSLAALREVVYERKVANLDELVDALECDFKGYEKLRTELLKAPKFGNDDERVDSLVPVVERIRREAITGLKGPRNDGRYITNHVVRSGHVTEGRNLGATPDGRFAGEPLADSCGASQGTDTSGLTALLNSVVKLDSINHWYGGYNFNITVQPNVFETKLSRKKIMDLLRSFFLRGGQELQINCVSADMLCDAQKHPENYRNLVVRVAGYNDYFTMLQPEIQNEIISRHEYNAA